MSWKDIVKDDNYERLHYRLIELDNEREELDKKLKTASPLQIKGIRRKINVIGREIIMIRNQIDDKYKHQEEHKGLDDESPKLTPSKRRSAFTR